MATLDFAFPQDAISGRDFGAGAARVTTVYAMRGIDDGTGEAVRWDVDGAPDLDGYQAPAVTGNLVSVAVERVYERLAATNVVSDYVWAWNSADLSQFTLVKGNGTGGHGVAGDHVMTLGTFPNDDTPAIVLTTPGTTNHAVWLIRDFPGPAPTQLRFCWRGLNGTLNSHREGLAFYYESTDYWAMVCRNNGSEMALGAYQAGFSSRGTLGVVADAAANRDTTFGDVFAANVLYSPASGAAKPWAVARAGGNALQGYGETGLPLYRTAAFGDGSAIGAAAGWTGLGTYAPRLALFVEGGGVAGTLYIGGLSVARGDGGV